MRFHFNELVLWLKNKRTRIIKFEPNKVNIITGGSNKGKTAILEIIDYCLFASKHKISDSIINENIEWYGLRFTINDKCYVIARKAPSENQVSCDYHFSSMGEIPISFPEVNITENSLKNLLETEFSIDSDTKVSYGGKNVKAGSRISLRYFLLLNTISQDIITHSEEFFDKQKNPRYREALPRTFDLAVGIDTASNILKREKREAIESELKKLEQEKTKRSRKQDAFYSQLTQLVKTAKEYSLVPENASIDEATLILKELEILEGSCSDHAAPRQFDEICAKINKLSRKILNLQRFSGEYDKYKANLKDANESLKSLEFLADHYSEVIKTSIYQEIITSLQEDHFNLRQAIASRTPLDSNISDIIKNYETQMLDLIDQRNLLPEENKFFENQKAKYIFIGEIKAKIDLYGKEVSSSNSEENHRIITLENRLESLFVESVDERRELSIRLLDEIIQDYIESTKSALENYQDYRSSFNYKEKKLQLRKPKSNYIENIGSSSNHMFLHLFLFLGLHELIIAQNSPYVPPFLIIDQFSRPYWGEEDKDKKILKDSDIHKVKTALELLNSFIERINERGAQFQMIVFEHIDQKLWSGMPHIHLVEVFRDGNALLPPELLSDNQRA